MDSITYSMVCFQIINLFSEKYRPQIFAEKLDHVEVIGEARAISGESVNWTMLVKSSSTHIIQFQNGAETV